MRRSTSDVWDCVQVHRVLAEESLVPRLACGVQASVKGVKRSHKDWDGGFLPEQMEVVLVRMGHAPHLNGLLGFVLRYSPDSKLYAVELKDRTEIVDVHRGNVLPADPGYALGLLRIPFGNGRRVADVLQGSWVDCSDPSCTYRVCGWQCTRTKQTKSSKKTTVFYFHLNGDKLFRGQKAKVFFEFTSHQPDQDYVVWQCEGNSRDTASTRYRWVRPGSLQDPAASPPEPRRAGRQHHGGAGPQSPMLNGGGGGGGYGQSHDHPRFYGQHGPMASGAVASRGHPGPQSPHMPRPQQGYSGGHHGQRQQGGYHTSPAMGAPLQSPQIRGLEYSPEIEWRPVPFGQPADRREPRAFPRRVAHHGRRRSGRGEDR